MASTAKKQSRDKRVQDAIKVLRKASKPVGASTKKKTAKKTVKKKATKRKSPVAKKSKAVSPVKKAPVKAPSSGQGGPKLELSWDRINSKEIKILDVLNGVGAGSREVWTIEELGAECFRSKPKKKQNSWVRNSLRRLIRSGLVDKIERGKYRVSDSARKRLSRAA